MNCGTTYDNGSTNYCINCGTLLQNIDGIPPISGRARTRRMLMLIAVSAVVILLLLTTVQYFLPNERESEGLLRTNNWIYDSDGNMYSLEFEIDADDLNAARKSTIDRSGSSSRTAYVVGSGSYARTVPAVEDYIVIGDTVTNLEILLRDVFPSVYGTADSTNDKYATFLINFCQSRGYTGDENMKYLTDWSTHGTDEYWNYPVETLYLMGGDCEDTSILMAALLRTAGFESGIALLPGHAMAMIEMMPAETPEEGLSFNDALLEYGVHYVKKIPYDSGGYWMLETTSYQILPGVIPGEYAFSTFHLFPSRSDAVYMS